MELPNRDGTPVDPVPFLVVTGIALATCYSFGPMYFAALGFRLPVGVAFSTVAFLGATVASFHQLVWTARPASERPPVPAGGRILRLSLLILIAIGVIVLLALPLVV